MHTTVIASGYSCLKSKDDESLANIYAVAATLKDLDAMHAVLNITVIAANKASQNECQLPSEKHLCMLKDCFYDPLFGVQVLVRLVAERANPTCYRFNNTKLRDKFLADVF